MERVIETDLTMEQAMSMVMTGGAVGPETIQYSTAEAARLESSGSRDSAPRGLEVRTETEATASGRGNQKESASIVDYDSQLAVYCLWVLSRTIAHYVTVLDRNDQP